KALVRRRRRASNRRHHEDTGNPPAFVAVIKVREAEDNNPSTYADAETAALQKRGYPDLASLSLALGPDKTFPIALATAKKMSWTIVEADPTTRRIEASERRQCGEGSGAVEQGA